MQPKRDSLQHPKYPLADDFPISTLGAYRTNLAAPAGTFDAAGNWTQVFGIHATGSGNSRVGTLTLSRRVRDDGGISLHVRHEKLFSGATMVGRGAAIRSRRLLEGTLQLGPAATRLSTPRRWSFRTRVLGGQGQPIPDASLERRAAVEKGQLSLTTGDGKPRILPLDGPYTVCWALFDAVARLPREAFDPIRFTLVDHFDQIKPQQTLVFRRTIETPIGGKTVRLFGFDQTGRGVMPWTYWVDEQGRTVVAQCGLETYMAE